MVGGRMCFIGGINSMSRLRILLTYCALILPLWISPLSHGAIIGDVIERITGKKSNNASKTDIDTNADHVPIGLTLQRYRAELKRLEKEMEKRFVRALASNQRSPELEEQLNVIQTRLQNVEQGYREHIEDLQKRIEQLESIREKVSGQLLNQTRQALSNGDYQQAEQLLLQMETRSAGDNHVTAETHYQRCQIAKDTMRYRLALTLCQRATQIAPDRMNYLSELAGLAQKLGEYEQAIAVYEQVLARSLETYGEDHPLVAVGRNNLGTVWDARGEYQKAIGYYEQALASDIKTYGDQHPEVAVDRNNLGMAWYELGEYKNAIVYLEQALASDINTYGADHLQVATYHNNLAGAWYRLGDYKKSRDHLEQALKIFENVLGESHPNTKGVRANYQQIQLDILGTEHESGSAE